jgi:hypothetical protein
MGQTQKAKQVFLRITKAAKNIFCSVMLLGNAITESKNYADASVIFSH